MNKQRRTVIKERRKFLANNQEIVANIIRSYGFDVVSFLAKIPCEFSCVWTFNVVDLTTQTENLIYVDYHFERRELSLFLYQKEASDGKDRIRRSVLDVLEGVEF